jgi:hypothetical protein
LSLGGQEQDRRRDFRAKTRENHVAMRNSMFRTGVCITVALVLAACSDDRKPAPGASTATEAATPPAPPPAVEAAGPATLKPGGPCMSNREVGAVVGRPLKQPETVPGGTFVICTYGTTEKPAALSIKLQPDFKASYLDLMRKPASPDAEAPIDLPDLGDDGFATQSGQFRTLRVVKGTTLIEVTSADPLEKQEELVRVILGKLE